MTRSSRARSSFRLGLVLAVVYALVAVVHARLGDNPRPLFDGFAPPPPYRWVNPPPEFRVGNQPPTPSTIDVPLGEEGSRVASGSSEDGQVILTFPAGAFPPHPPDSHVEVQVTPIDPAVLPPAPPGLAPDGNAYRLDFTYQPSGEPAGPLAVPADIFLVVPEPAQTLLFSPEGQAWGSLPFRPVPDPTQIGGTFATAGYFLAVAPPVARPSDLGGGESEAVRLVRVAAVTIALALSLALVPAGWRRLRR